MASPVIPNQSNRKITRVVWLHRFVKKSRKLKCPSCGHYTFVPYYNVETGKPFDDNLFGKCDRLINCGCHIIPNVQDYRDRGLVVEVEKDKPLPPCKVHPVIEQLMVEEADDEFDVINQMELFKSITLPYDKISLYRWLCSYFKKDLVDEVFRHYMVGYSHKYQGSPIFWQIDIHGNIRTGKIMGYNPGSGKRVKSPCQIWYQHLRDPQVKELNGDNNYRYVQCLYGEHLINQYNKFAIVESEKTALICTLYSWMLGERDTLWLATSGLECIRNSIFRVLEGRKVTFFPDKGKALHKWKERINEKLAKEISHYYTVSNALENVSELKEGDDIGDYCILKLKKNKK